MYTPQQQAAHKAMREQRKADQVRIKNYLRSGRPINPERMRNIRSAGTCVGGSVFQMIPGFNYRPVRNIQGMKPIW